MSTRCEYEPGCHSWWADERCSCGGSLECEDCYPGGGSHYWTLRCQACRLRYTFSNHDCELRLWPDAAVGARA